MSKNITIADVAEALGVSKTTVSRAISGKGRIGEATRNRVLAYIEENDYKPNVIAKSLAQSKTFNLGIVMPSNYELVDLPFFQEVIMGIQKIHLCKRYRIWITKNHFMNLRIKLRNTQLTFCKKILTQIGKPVIHGGVKLISLQPYPRILPYFSYQQCI